MNKEFLFKSQDKINNKINFNKMISKNIFKLFINQKPINFEIYLKENKLAKNRTYNNLIKKQNKSKFQLYNFTTPNKDFIKNSNILFLNHKNENENENKEDVLPLLFKDSNKVNLNKNKYFNTIHFS